MQDTKRLHAQQLVMLPSVTTATSHVIRTAAGVVQSCSRAQVVISWATDLQSRLPFMSESVPLATHDIVRRLTNTSHCQRTLFSDAQHQHPCHKNCTRPERITIFMLLRICQGRMEERIQTGDDIYTYLAWGGDIWERQALSATSTLLGMSGIFTFDKCTSAMSESPETTTTPGILGRVLQ